MEEDIFQDKPTEVLETSAFARIIVVRHAESVANVQGIFQGQTYDTDLSELGRTQAQALAKRLSKLNVKKIISSPLKRAYQTALEISRLSNIGIEISRDIIETNHGLWEGKSKEWILSNFRQLYEDWQKIPTNVVFPGGESFLNAIQRVEKFLEEKMLEDGTVIVSHDNIIRIIASQAVDYNYANIWSHKIESAAINVFEIGRTLNKPKLRMVAINDTEHLYGLRADVNNHAL